jgi:hypothetical protein
MKVYVARVISAAKICSVGKKACNIAKIPPQPFRAAVRRPPLSDEAAYLAE